ncbi:MAG: hypothetical protein HRF49_11525 [bacterium]|jgi:hypothetical protein
MLSIRTNDGTVLLLEAAPRGTVKVGCYKLMTEFLADQTVIAGLADFLKETQPPMKILGIKNLSSGNQTGNELAKAGISQLPKDCGSDSKHLSNTSETGDSNSKAKVSVRKSKNPI